MDLQKKWQEVSLVVSQNQLGDEETKLLYKLVQLRMLQQHTNNLIDGKVGLNPSQLQELLALASVVDAGMEAYEKFDQLISSAPKRVVEAYYQLDPGIDW